MGIFRSTGDEGGDESSKNVRGELYMLHKQSHQTQSIVEKTICLDEKRELRKDWQGRDQGDGGISMPTILSPAHLFRQTEEKAEQAHPTIP